MMAKLDSKRQIWWGYYLLFFLIALSSCDNKIKREDPKSIVQKWIGKEIKFPQNLPYFELGKITKYNFDNPKPYKILVYTDSIGCTSCKLELDIWKDLIQETDSLMPNKITWLFYFSPKKDEDISKLFIARNFRVPVRIDGKDQINEMNHFPKHIDYQTFLLDSNNKVLLVGNPTLKASIWNLYKKMINNQIDINVK